jgi:hypothetical protein
MDNVHPIIAAALTRQLEPHNMGPLTAGHYIQVGMGFGFYVPEADFAELQKLANVTHRIQFLGVTTTGEPIYGTREEIHARPDSAGLIAWIVPQD